MEKSEINPTGQAGKTAEEVKSFLESQQIIETTDLKFRCKVQTKNDFIKYDIVSKTLEELIADFASLKVSEKEKEIERLQISIVDITEKAVAKLDSQQAMLNRHKINLIDVCEYFISVKDKDMTQSELEHWIMTVGNKLDAALTEFKQVNNL